MGRKQKAENIHTAVGNKNDDESDLCVGSFAEVFSWITVEKGKEFRPLKRSAFQWLNWQYINNNSPNLVEFPTHCPSRLKSLVNSSNTS